MTKQREKKRKNMFASTIETEFKNLLSHLNFKCETLFSMHQAIKLILILKLLHGVCVCGFIGMHSKISKIISRSIQKKSVM